MSISIFNQIVTALLPPFQDSCLANHHHLALPAEACQDEVVPYHPAPVDEGWVHPPLAVEDAACPLPVVAFLVVDLLGRVDVVCLLEVVAVRRSLCLDGA